ncbi:MAG: hypothetical protein AAF621_04200, partial [Pseudomonadota bacterium]
TGNIFNIDNYKNLKNEIQKHPQIWMQLYYECMFTTQDFLNLSDDRASQIILSDFERWCKRSLSQMKGLYLIGPELFLKIDRLKITEDRKNQIFTAIVSFSMDDHLKDNIVHPNKVIDDDLTATFNYEAGGEDMPILLALPNLIAFDDIPKTVYAATYTEDEIEEIEDWQVPDTLKQKISQETKEDLKNRKGKINLTSLHDDFISHAAYNVEQICQDLLHKQNKGKMTLEDLKGVRMLSSLDQADTHNVGLRIIFPEERDHNGKLNVRIEIIDSVSREQEDKTRPYQHEDFQNILHIVEHYVKEIIDDTEDKDKLSFNLDIKYTGLQIGGYCTTHAQISALEGAHKAETSEDFIHDPLWMLKQIKKLLKFFDSKVDPKIIENLKRIYDAVSVDIRRVYFNKPELYHYYADLPINEEGRHVLVGDPVPARPELVPFAKPDISDQEIGLEYEKLLEARMKTEEKYQAQKNGLESQSVLEARQAAEKKYQVRKIAKIYRAYKARRNNHDSNTQ